MHKLNREWYQLLDSQIACISKEVIESSLASFIQYFYPSNRDAGTGDRFVHFYLEGALGFL